MEKQQKHDYTTFNNAYPQYTQTEDLDRLRKKEFRRLEKAKEIYVDYMGGALWPENLVATHSAILQAGLFGNTHSDSPCALRSDHHIAAARRAVLDFFDAPSSEYVCIFTTNATAALKIVGESFPFDSTGRVVLPVDCHNSVNGIRRFAERAGAAVTYLSAGSHGGFSEREALDILHQNSNANHGPSLFVVTGQSNITGIRPPLSILAAAKQAGWATLLDAAALASSTRISLRSLAHADAMAISFYKMFGYPTGVGALIAKKSFLATLNRPWFSGGSVDFVQSPGAFALPASDLIARFEEGTLNYACLSAIEPGLEFLKKYMPSLTVRLPALHHYLHTCLESLVYPGTNTPLIRIHTKKRGLNTPAPLTYPRGVSSETPFSSSTASFKWLFTRKPTSSGLPTPPHTPKMEPKQLQFPSSNTLSLPSQKSSRRPVTAPARTPGEATTAPSGIDSRQGEAQSEEGQGYVLSCTFYTRSGEMIPLSHISKLAAAQGISLRTGCVCNPGGAAALRGGGAQQKMQTVESVYVDSHGGLPTNQRTKADMQRDMEEVWSVVGGMDGLGVVRISLGLANNFDDIWRLVAWAKSLLDEPERERKLARLLA